MKKIVVILFIAFPLVGFGQSFIFCPDIKTEIKENLAHIELSIVFKDSRVFKKKVKEKCSKTEIFNEFVRYIKQTYPSVNIKVLSENSFDETPKKGSITIKVDFKKYDVTFYTGLYVANTVFSVKIVDYRNEEKIFQDTISAEGRQFNALGFKSGIIASNSSFKVAFDKFILLTYKITPSSNNPIKIEQLTSDKSINQKSKADRLRELKRLLDEKILTQEEFDNEKRKILEEQN